MQELISVKEQLLRELDMYQEIAVSRGGEYDRLNQNMDRCQENIETLSDEIQRLQGMYERKINFKSQLPYSCQLKFYIHAFWLMGKDDSD